MNHDNEALDYATHTVTHLDAIAANLRAIRAHVGGIDDGGTHGPQILLAIKADGYGHGAVRIARMVQDLRLAERLGVATVPEAAALRQAGITLPILKLSGVFAQEAAAAVAIGLDLTVPDAATARIIQAAAASRADGSDQAHHQPVAVHLKVDTGMRRIGCDVGEAPGLAALIENECPDLRLEGIFTHLPASDTPAEDEFTAGQVARFAAAREAVESVVGRRLIAHAANSGGVLAHPSSWFDLVRPGIMVYGSYPDPDVPRTVPLRPALSWRSRVSFVKDVPAGETVGYGRTWVAPAATRIATVPVGYADGYNRRLSNRGEVLIRGRRLPVVGRVCMDQVMVDLGPGSDVAVGDAVTLLGRDGAEEITAWHMAAWLGTIPYEVTCALAPRVTRTYVEG
ncbi:MAG: alanine racemase [Austwickia sp.]|jgi:alanine racemase|nr:MAG: alanine racemase [Austwickia sp.]